MSRHKAIAFAKRFLTRRAGPCAALILCAFSVQADCGRERHFGPHDVTQQAALARPHADFVKTYRLATAGVAAEARNLAAFYDTGYLVSMCREKALYWYTRAAEQGDEHAREWLERHMAVERLREGPECFGEQCAAAGSGPRTTTLLAGPNGAYAANVTINGKTVRGIIDTGATLIAMSAKTAQELGLTFAAGRQLQMRTANGTITSRGITLGAVTVGNITLTQVEAAVSESDHPLLVGMSFLKRLTVNTSGGAMTLVKP